MNRLAFALILALSSFTIAAPAAALEAPASVADVEILTSKSPMVYFRWPTPSKPGTWSCVLVDGTTFSKVAPNVQWESAVAYLLKQSANLPPLSAEERALCAVGLPLWFVEKNRDYATRPLYDDAGKSIGRIEIGRPCEGKTIRETGTTKKNYYQYATNADGVRGITICELRSP